MKRLATTDVVTGTVKGVGAAAQPAPGAPRCSSTSPTSVRPAERTCAHEARRSGQSRSMRGTPWTAGTLAEGPWEVISASPEPPREVDEDPAHAAPHLAARR
jgi:hypothetical protein